MNTDPHWVRIPTPKMTSFGKILIPFRYLIYWGRRIGYNDSSEDDLFWRNPHSSFQISHQLRSTDAHWVLYTDPENDIFLEEILDPFRYLVNWGRHIWVYRLQRAHIFREIISTQNMRDMWVGSISTSWPNLQVCWFTKKKLANWLKLWGKKKTREERRRAIITSGGEQTQSLGVLTRRSVVYPNQIPLPDRYLSQPRQKIPGLRI